MLNLTIKRSFVIFSKYIYLYPNILTTKDSLVLNSLQFWILTDTKRPSIDKWKSIWNIFWSLFNYKGDNLDDEALSSFYLNNIEKKLFVKAFYTLHEFWKQSYKYFYGIMNNHKEFLSWETKVKEYLK